MTLKAIDLNDVEIRGDLAVRSVLNYGRLEGQWYRPWEVFGADKHGWPGDWEGRVILALVSQARATKRTPAWLDAILAELPRNLNERGYLGKICESGWVNEQQLAGHSWLTRGLIAYCDWKRSPEIRAVVEGIVRNLILAAASNFRNYPITAEQVCEPDHWELSHPQSKTQSHKGSIDTGCGFILLDGLTEAYRFFQWPELKAMIEVVIQRFLKLDLEGGHVQTHATLTCLRGICRYVELGGPKKYLTAARQIIDRYQKVAMTEHYGNYNWWGRPRWTEPCAIIDSYILANWLWKLTGESKYQADAHHIFYNGVAHAFRAEGCFGTDWCLGAVPPDEDGGVGAHHPLVLQPRTYEVYWCCTMRGGELFARAAEAVVATDGEAVWFPIFHNCTVTVDGLTLRETTNYPYEGAVRVDIMAAKPGRRRTLKFFLPPWKTRKPVMKMNGKPMAIRVAKGFVSVSVNFRPGDVLEYEFGLGLHVAKPHNENTVKKVHSFRHGPLLLALVQAAPESGEAAKPTAPVIIRLSAKTHFEVLGRGKYREKGGKVILSPVYDVESLTQRWHARQALFEG